MSLLHSFYCWGHMGVVLLSTAFFALFGIGHWKLLALLWALVPVANAIFFAGAPLYPIHAEGDQALSLHALVKSRVFWLFMLMMLCAGASEQAVSQWSSAFAEQGLGVSKTVGDLAGPMAFGSHDGVSRLIFGKYGEKLNLNRYMAGLHRAVHWRISLHCFRSVFRSEPTPAALCAASRSAFSGPERSAVHPLPSGAAGHRCSRCWRWRVISAAQEADARGPRLGRLRRIAPRGHSRRHYLPASDAALYAPDAEKGALRL